METLIEMKKTLEEDRKSRIIKKYLKKKFNESFDPAWLTSRANYRELEKTLDFLYNLEEDKLSLIAIGSENKVTRQDYQKHFENLANILDSLISFSKETPPVALPVSKKELSLKAIAIKQSIGSLTLRDLHAQNSNLGIAEKFLNAELGQFEWLSEVDLERALNKLGIKDRVHITRLSAEDIGMILHFEREKHVGTDQPYSIPLLINCGSSGSLRSQGAHWTEALITVYPDGRINVDYRDSMYGEDEVRQILNEAIHYQEISIVNEVQKTYTAFPDVDELDLIINITSENSQVDGWSCGYRALYNLLRDANFPTNGIATGTAPWTTIINSQYTSTSLRNAIYHLILENLQINEDFFVAMQLSKEAFKHLEDSKNYGLEESFTDHYLELLSEDKTNTTLKSSDFEEEYLDLVTEFNKIEFKTNRKKTLEELKAKVQNIVSGSLSPDAKIFILLDVLANEWDNIVNSRGGSGSELGKAIAKFCEGSLGVKLGKGPTYEFKKDGLVLRIITHLGDLESKKIEGESLLPPPQTPQTTNRISSAPVIGNPKVENPKVSPSEGSIDSKTAPGQISLLKKQDLSRVGTMFGPTQFCYGEKVGGVEPGFRAIDLDESFFDQLTTIVLPESEREPLAAKFNALIKIISEKNDLKEKQIVFAMFINTHVPRLHAKGQLDPSITLLCDQIKETIKHNKELSAWLYKLDYAESGAKKNRESANTEALREFVGTRLAGIFSEKNQRQEILWVRGPKGPHALLACGWKNNLRELKDFLHGGHAPDWNGVLVEDPKAPVKYAKYISGLAQNLIFGIAIGDRDGIGKEGQNKGYDSEAESFYGFDYGKTYDGDGVCGTLKDDFTFYNPGSRAPGMFRSEGSLGLARHLMYRNYSIFFDTAYADRMMGVHIWKKMVTGENPSEEIIKSYPGLRQELFRIQDRTPTTATLLGRLAKIRAGCPEGEFQKLVDQLSGVISSEKLSPFELYFVEIKLDLIAQALKSNMPYAELNDYMHLLDNWTKKAATNNQQILTVFAKRLVLTKEEITFLDHLEKIVSPVSILSHDGEAILNHLRITDPKERIPFQLFNLKNGTYVLTTTNKKVAMQLKEKLGLEARETDEGLSFNLSEENLAHLMIAVNKQYETKKQELVNEATYNLSTLPHLKKILPSELLPRLYALLNQESTETQKMEMSYKWLSDDSLSLLFNLKTEEQAKQIQIFFQLPTIPKLNIPIEVEIPSLNLQKLATFIDRLYRSNSEEMMIEMVELSLSHIAPESQSSSEIDYTKEREALINRFRGFGSIEEKTLAQLENAIAEMTSEQLEILLGYNDNTLKNPTNIKHILTDSIEKIVRIPQDIVSTLNSNIGYSDSTHFTK